MVNVNDTDTTITEKIVALGGGFQDFRQPTLVGETATNMIVATLRSTVTVQYGRGASGPQDAVVKAVQYWIKNDGSVQVTLIGSRLAQTIAPSAIVGLSWSVTA